MLCDICKKKKATAHLTEIVNDEMSELHLCEDCAKAKGAQMQQHFSIADLLSGLVDFPMEPAAKKEHVKIKCPSCGMTYADFKKLGRFGCSSCYEAFKRVLYPLFKSIHGTTHHIGKKPKETRVQKPKPALSKAKIETEVNELEDLKARLARAIQKEEFEEAAVLRNKIRALEARNK
jgi:protein arginine kinase activator